MKTFFKTPEGIYKLDFELKKLEKLSSTSTVAPKTFRLHQHSVQHSKVEKFFFFFFKFQKKKLTEEVKFLVSQNTTKKIYVYNLNVDQKVKVLKF
jgi:hypothetical protein